MVEQKQSVLNLFKNYKKLGRKEFSKKWKRGIQKVSPEDQTKTQVIGYAGMICASIIVIINFAVRGSWELAVFFGFSLIVQGSTLLGKYQELQRLKLIGKIQEEEIPIEQILNMENDKKAMELATKSVLEIEKRFKEEVKLEEKENGV